MFLSSYCKSIFNYFCESDLSFGHIWSKLSNFESREHSYPYSFYTCWIPVLWLVVRSATQLLQLYKVHMHRGFFSREVCRYLAVQNLEPYVASAYNFSYVTADAEQFDSFRGSGSNIRTTNVTFCIELCDIILLNSTGITKSSSSNNV